MQTLLVYGIMFGTSVFFANRAKKTGIKWYILMIIFVLAFVCGCRAYTVGNDTESYYEICESILKTNLNPYVNMEKGFEYYCRALLAIVPQPQLVLIITALISSSLVVLRLWDFRTVAEFDWAVAYFIASFFPFLLSGIRQGLSLAIVFWSTRYLEKKNYCFYVILVAVASVIHKSAAVAFVNFVWEIRLWRELSISKRRFLILCIALALPAGLYLMTLKYTTAQYIKDFSINPGTKFIAEFGIAILSLIAFDYDYIQAILEEFQSNCTQSLSRIKTMLRNRIHTVKFYYIVGVLANTTGYISTTIGRLALYWYWFSAVFMGMLVKSEKNRLFFKIMVSLFIIYSCYYDLTHNGYSQFPYLFFWQITR